MDADEITTDDEVSLDEDNAFNSPKKTWKSLPTEIKQKIIKFLPLRTRIANKEVCKQWLEMVTDLNNQQNTLYLVVEEFSELPAKANSLCNLECHAFKHSSMLLLPDHGNGQQLAKNFPNLKAVHFAEGETFLNISDYLGIFIRLEHFSYDGYCHGWTQEDFDHKEWSCLRIKRKHARNPVNVVNIDLRSLVNLKYYDGRIENVDHFSEMINRGLVGYSIDLLIRFGLTKEVALKTEVLYGVNYHESELLMTTTHPMPKLTTIYGYGDRYGLESLGRMTGLTKLTWKDSGRWTEWELNKGLKICGHRLQSLRIEVDLYREWTIKSVVKWCPNLVELHISRIRFVEPDSEDKVHVRDQVREYELLKQLTKLKTLSVDNCEVDLKFLKMLDPDLPEVKAMGRLGVQATIKQLVYYQFEICYRKSNADLFKAKELRELKSHLA